MKDKIKWLESYINNLKGCVAFETNKDKIDVYEAVILDLEKILKSNK